MVNLLEPSGPHRPVMGMLYLYPYLLYFSDPYYIFWQRTISERGYIHYRLKLNACRLKYAVRNVEELEPEVIDKECCSDETQQWHANGKVA
jgi:hypothetical protein